MDNKTYIIQSDEISMNRVLKLSMFLWYNYLIKKISIRPHNFIVYYTILWIFFSVEPHGNKFDLFGRRCFPFLDNRALNE